jgi:sporulation protein YlmC with PRC-barrel domain
MAETIPFTIGAEVSCSDGVCGKLSRVVIDPVAKTLTHLVVTPDDPWQGLGQLVPVDLAEVTADGITLRCTKAEFAKMKAAYETHFIPSAWDPGPYSGNQMLAWPYYGLGAGLAGTDSIGMEMAAAGQTVVEDKVPVGEVEVARGDHVHATDGNIGRVQGLVIDPSDHHVTHVLLQEGHLWGRKQVTIPISAVTEVSEDGIHISLTKQAVQDLPVVDLANQQD